MAKRTELINDMTWKQYLSNRNYLVSFGAEPTVVKKAKLKNMTTRRIKISFEHKKGFPDIDNDFRISSGTEVTIPKATQNIILRYKNEYPDSYLIFEVMDVLNTKTVEEKKLFSDDSDQLEEGAKTQVTVNKYERDPKLRQQAIKEHGYDCMACDFNFEKIYGEIGKNFVEVHHNTPLSKLGESKIIDPKNDLSILCSNCHRMVHRSYNKLLSVAELRIILKKLRIGN